MAPRMSPACCSSSARTNSFSTSCALCAVARAGSATSTAARSAARGNPAMARGPDCIREGVCQLPGPDSLGVAVLEVVLQHQFDDAVAPLEVDAAEVLDRLRRVVEPAGRVAYVGGAAGAV